MSTPEYNASIVSITSKIDNPGTTMLTLSTNESFEFGGITYDPGLSVDESGNLRYRAMLRIAPRPDKLINLEVGPLITPEQQVTLEERSNIHPLFVLQTPPSINTPSGPIVSKITVHPSSPSPIAEEATIQKHISVLTEVLRFFEKMLGH